MGAAFGQASVYLYDAVFEGAAGLLVASRPVPSCNLLQLAPALVSLEGLHAVSWEGQSLQGDHTAL